MLVLLFQCSSQNPTKLEALIACGKENGHIIALSAPSHPCWPSTFSLFLVRHVDQTLVLSALDLAQGISLGHLTEEWALILAIGVGHIGTNSWTPFSCIKLRLRKNFFFLHLSTNLMNDAHSFSGWWITLSAFYSKCFFPGAVYILKSTISSKCIQE